MLGSGKGIKSFGGQIVAAKDHGHVVTLFDDMRVNKICRDFLDNCFRCGFDLRHFFHRLNGELGILGLLRYETGRNKQ